MNAGRLHSHAMWLILVIRRNLLRCGLRNAEERYKVVLSPLYQSSNSFTFPIQTLTALVSGHNNRRKRKTTMVKIGAAAATILNQLSIAPND